LNLSGRDRQRKTCFAQAVHGAAGTCHQLFLLCRGGSARVDGNNGLSPLRRDDRADADARQAASDRALEGTRLDFSKLFHKPVAAHGESIFNSTRQDHGLDKVLDRKLIAAVKDSIETGAPVTIDIAINNTDRTTGAMLSAPSRAAMACGACRRDHSYQSQGDRRAKFRRLAAAGSLSNSRGKPMDYCARALRRPISLSPAQARITPEKIDHHLNTPLYGRDRRRMLFSVLARANVSRSATLVRSRSSRCRRSMLRIYDGWRCRRQS